MVFKGRQQYEKDKRIKRMMIKKKKRTNVANGMKRVRVDKDAHSPVSWCAKKRNRKTKRGRERMRSWDGEGESDRWWWRRWC